MNDSSCPLGAPVIEYFDHNSPDYGRCRFAWFKAIRDQVGPVFWTPHNGGLWVVIGWEELTQAAKHWELFSSKGVDARPEPERHGDLQFKGLFAPPRPTSGPMLEEDPPDWSRPRKALTPFFTMAAADLWRERFRELTDACLDRCIETGRIDFARDLSAIVPTIFSLELVGVDAQGFEQVSRAFHLTSHMTPDDPGWDAAMADLQGMSERIWAAVLAEKDKPAGQRRPGQIGALLDARDKGADFTDKEIFDLAILTIAAGIDTTSASLGSVFVILTQRPDLRAQLLSGQATISDAFHEFIRITTPTSGLCRTATQDTELGGQKIRRGDRVMLCFAAASRDPREFADAEEIVLDRKPNRHTGFGTGIHRCIGANYAQVEFEVLLSRVLERMPDFQVDIPRAESYENIGIVAGWKAIPATFTPGVRVGVDPKVPGWRF